MQNTPASLEDTKSLIGERLLLVTKLAIPPVRSDLVARPRLTNQLQLGIQRPFTLIAAPAGFGKTTVLSTWLESAPFSAAWVSLESSDDDLIKGTIMETLPAHHPNPSSPLDRHTPHQKPA